MSGGLVLILPLVVFVSLALLPAGRQALVGLAIAALLAAAFRWMSGAAGLAFLAGAGVAMAALAQGLRAGLGPRLSRLMYLALLPAIYMGWLALLQAGFGG